MQLIQTYRVWDGAALRTKWGTGRIYALFNNLRVFTCNPLIIDGLRHAGVSREDLLNGIEVSHYVLKGRPNAISLDVHLQQS